MFCNTISAVPELGKIRTFEKGNVNIFFYHQQFSQLSGQQCLPFIYSLYIN